MNYTYTESGSFLRVLHPCHPPWRDKFRDRGVREPAKRRYPVNPPLEENTRGWWRFDPALYLVSSSSPCGSSPLRHEWRHVVARQPHPHDPPGFSLSFVSIRPLPRVHLFRQGRGGCTRRRQSLLGLIIYRSGSSLISKITLLTFGRPPLLKLIGLNRWDVIALLRALSGWCKEPTGDVIWSSLIGILIGRSSITILIRMLCFIYFFLMLIYNIRIFCVLY